MEKPVRLEVVGANRPPTRPGWAPEIQRDHPSATPAAADRDPTLRFLFLAWRDLAHPLAGGSEVLVDRLARGLVERGHGVELLCGGPSEPRLYPVTSTGGTYGQYLRSPLRYLARHRRVDVVVDVVNGMPFFSPLWRRRPTICLVNHLHLAQWGLWFPRPLAALGRSVETRVLPRLYRRQLFMAVSRSTAAALESVGVDPGRIRVVHNGVDPADHRPAKSAEPLFVAVGRLVPHKRFDLLLRLWDTVRPLTGGRLVIAGDGPERGRLEALAGPGVSLPGWVSEHEKQDLLAAAWLLVHPALVEGWGLVVMEAAARRTPTLGFDVPGLRDSVVDGESGVLAASEADLARSWVALAADQATRERLGRAARSRARGFSWSSTVEGFLDVAAAAVDGAGADVRAAAVDGAGADDRAGASPVRR